MKCSIEGCPERYEERKIVHTVRYQSVGWVEELFISYQLSAFIGKGLGTRLGTRLG